MNTPQTLQGTNGLMTVPASSSVRARLRECRPSLSYTGLKVSPESRILKYCSPIRKLTPTDVMATLKVARPALVRNARMASSKDGITPMLNNRPPKLMPSITMVCVKNMLSKPPREIKRAMSLNASPSSLYPL